MKKLFLPLAFLALIAAVCLFYRDSFIRKTSLSPPNGRRGVVFHDRIRATAGYHLLDHYLHNARCTFADNPEPAKFIFPGSFCTVLKDGSYISYLVDQLVLWRPDGLPAWKVINTVHHDISVDEKNGTVFIVTWQPLRKKGVKGKIDTDTIRGYNLRGEQVFAWKFPEHMREFESVIKQPVQRQLSEPSEPVFEFTHINSVQEIPENPVAAKVPAFRAGNILVNDFRYGVIFVIDRRTKKIVWHYYPEHGVLAHSVRLNEEGLIVFLSNKKNKTVQGKSRYSSIDFLDPIKKEIAYSITTSPKKSFSTSYWGSLQLLPGNRFLVTSSMSGSAFEIDKSGRIFWEWVNPENEGDHIKPIYRVMVTPKERVDTMLATWKPF
jgi:hypothetical protein